MRRLLRDILDQLRKYYQGTRRPRRTEPPRRRPTLEALEERLTPAAAVVTSPASTISGQIFFVGTDGTQIGAPGVPVFLEGNVGPNATGPKDHIDAMVTTDANGKYTFTQVLSPPTNTPPYTYTVVENPLSPFQGTAVLAHVSIDKDGETVNNVNGTVTAVAGASLNQIMTDSGTPSPRAGSGTKATFTLSGVTPLADMTVTSGVPVDFAANFLAPNTQDTIIQFNMPDPNNAGKTLSMKLELFDKEAPQTVTNFLNYIESGAYTNSIFQRLGSLSLTASPRQVLQGGSLQFSSPGDVGTLTPITELPSIANEFSKSRSNVAGTIAMAQSTGPASATDGFFFNLTNNAKSLDSQQFTVFGKVLNMGVLNKITSAPYTIFNQNNLPPGSPSSAITSATESGSTVTITTATALGLTVGSGIFIQGVGVSGYNGYFTIATISGTTITYTDTHKNLGSSSGGTASSATTIPLNTKFYNTKNIPTAGNNDPNFPGDAKSPNDYDMINLITLPGGQPVTTKGLRYTVTSSSGTVTVAEVKSPGEPNAPVGTSLPYSNNRWTFTGATGATATITVVVTDPAGNSVTETFKVTMA